MGSDYVTHPPDMLGVIYTDVTITNNTDVPIKQLYLTMLDEVGRATHNYGYFPEDSTIAPGESVTLTSFGADELTPIRLTYSFYLDDVEYDMEYDFTLDHYQQLMPIRGA